MADMQVAVRFWRKAGGNLAIVFVVLKIRFDRKDIQSNTKEIIKVVMVFSSKR